jgi:hypothetical protein
VTARPTSNLDWGGTQNEPSSGAKSAGYATGARPAAQHLNWIFGNIDEWTKYLDEQNDLLPGKLADLVQANADAPLVASQSTAQDHPGNATNAWKEIFKFAIANGTFFRLLVSDGDAAHWAITTNAKWNPAPSGPFSQAWSHDDPTEPAYLINLESDGSVIYGKVPASGGPSTWENWAGATLRADEQVISDSFVHASPITRTKMLPLFEAQPLALDTGTYWWTQGSPACLEANAAGDEVRIPIRLPAGAVLQSVQVMVDQETAATMTCRVFRNGGHDFTTPAAGSQTQLASVTTTSATGVKVASMSSINHTVDNSTGELYLFVEAGAAADRIRAARVTFTDPGPRNY